jgi:hypothetical protein
MTSQRPNSSGEYCLRCKDSELEVLSDSSPEITFYACPTCGRHYAKQPGESLHDRWLSPLSGVLYGVIFGLKPQKRAKEMAEHFYQGREFCTEEWLKVYVLGDIQSELEHPKQKVKEILEGMRASEEDLREYLRLFAEELKALLKED